jgi:predicted anti-sigma-YlaC factor YlaD
MSAGARDPLHPDLERYYESATDREDVDTHLSTCGACRAWLEDIHDPLRDLRCNELVELVTWYLDDALDSRVRAQIDDHLRLCEGCRIYLDQMRSTVAALGRIGGSAEPSEPVQVALLAAFRAWRPSRSVDPEHEH